MNQNKEKQVIIENPNSDEYLATPTFDISMPLCSWTCW